MNVQRINSTNFNAIPIAKVNIKGLDKTYKLYEITRRDSNFLEQFYKNLNLKELMEGLSEEEYDTWNGVIKSSIELANKSGTKTIVETCNDTPCGILNYSPFANKFHLNYVATFPVEKNKKTPFAGQILFNEFFKRLLDSWTDTIELNALRNSPFSPISTYLKLGFKPLGGNGFSERMKISRNSITSTIEKQESFIDYQKSDGKEIFLDGKEPHYSFFKRLLLLLFSII